MADRSPSQPIAADFIVQPMKSRDLKRSNHGEGWDPEPQVNASSPPADICMCVMAPTAESCG